MNKIFFLIIFLIVNHGSYSETETQNKLKKDVEYKLLFVGNSLTYYNNLPRLVANYAHDKGISLQTKSLAKANYAIVDHWAEGEVQELIKSKEYDYVIIQQGPSSQADGYDMLVNGGKLYSELCKANDAQLVYFMVWPSLLHYNSFDGVIANYTAGAEANEALLSPVGKVWKEHIDSTGDISYYGSDGFHPSLKGSLLAAEVIVESIFAEQLANQNFRQAWLTGVGEIHNNSIQVEEVYLTENGRFGDNFNPDEINNIYWGELNIDFNSCNTANMTFSSTLTNPVFGSGGYSLVRLAQNEESINCEEIGFTNNQDKSFFSGTYYGGPERSGEGFMIDYLDANRAIVSWFTYMPEFKM